MGNQSYLDMISKIDQNYKTIKSMCAIPKNEVAYFMREFSIITTHNSNAIEGNTFSFDETKLLIENGIIYGTHSLRESEDIVGYKTALDFLYLSQESNTVISEEFIKELHSYVLRGEEGAGKYKTTQNYIGDMTRIIFEPASPKEVLELMPSYVNTLNKDIERNKKLIQNDEIEWNKIFSSLAEHHIQFENIHPFIDGNGRTGRLLLTYEMLTLGLLPIDIRYEERERYYAGFKAYRRKEKYSTREGSNTEKMANLIAERELSSMELWVKTFSAYKHDNSQNLNEKGCEHER